MSEHDTATEHDTASAGDTPESGAAAPAAGSGSGSGDGTGDGDGDGGSRGSGVARVLGVLTNADRVQNLILLVVIVVIAGFVTSRQPAFLTWNNLSVAVTGTVILYGLTGLAELLVIIIGGLDISVGSTVGLTSVVGALIWTHTGQNAALATLGALAVGLACGLVNGLLIIYGRVNPFIATLATLAAFKGLGQVMSDGGAIGSGFSGNALFIFLQRGAVAGLPTQLFILVITALALAFLLMFTDIGRNVYAIGGNPTAARLAGVSINRYVLAVYLVVGLVSAVAGVILMARQGFGQQTGSVDGLELKAVTVAALGGASLRGGRGGVLGAVLAIVLLGFLENGMNVLNINTFWQNVAQGTLLLIAVIAQQRRRKERPIGIPD
jgi:ribose transport system permease protein